MAVFDPGRLYGRHEAPRAGRAARTIPLYAAVFGIGAMVVGGSAFVLDQPTFARSQAGVVQAPRVQGYRGSQLGQPASQVPVIAGGTLQFEVLGPEDYAPAVAVTAPATVPVVEPPASAPPPSLAQSAPVAAPAQTAPVAPAAAPVTPAEPVAPPAATVPEPVAPPPAPAFYVPAVSGGPMTGLEQRFFDGMNAERAAAGLSPYVYDSGLSTIARTRSQQMVDQGYFGHRDPNGYSMYVELLAYFGYSSYAWAGENLAVNNYGDGESPERAIASLMNSPTHRSNILQNLFTRVGIGEVTHADGRKFYTMIFLG